MLFITGTTFELMAGIGLVILVGIVVNNAIVLVDRVQQHRETGMARDEALLAGGRERFRPIVMTAATTIVGLLPMAIGKAGVIGIPYFPLARAVIGGLLASTVLSLLLVPLFYTYLDDFKALLRETLRRGTGR
jgi:HAE1 family hydrophobic/amphiphilic exporter-1